MTSTDALIRQLSTHPVPVKRRNVRWEAAALLALGAVELVLVLTVAAMRYDASRVVPAPIMLWKLASLSCLAIVNCTTALRTFAPSAALYRGPALVLGLTAAAMIAGAFLTPAADSGRPLIERLAPAHGLICATSIAALSLPIMILLGVLMRRAAPVRPAHSALATGLAASTCGALLFAVCCPMPDPLYVIVWYSVGSATIVAISWWLLPRRFRL